MVRLALVLSESLLYCHSHYALSDACGEQGD